MVGLEHISNLVPYFLAKDDGNGVLRLRLLCFELSHYWLSLIWRRCPLLPQARGYKSIRYPRIIAMHQIQIPLRFL